MTFQSSPKFGLHTCAQVPSTLPVCACFPLCTLSADALVINRYQLLKSLNPHIELVAEIMLPHNMVYLAPMTPVRGINNKYLHLLAPAYVSGSGRPRADAIRLRGGCGLPCLQLTLFVTHTSWLDVYNAHTCTCGCKLWRAVSIMLD